MLDFRFLLAAVVIFVATIVAGVRIFGASEPLLATMGDQPRVEAVALPRQVPPTKPNAPKVASPDRPFVRPAAVELPSARPPAKAATSRPADAETTASIDLNPVPLPEAEEAKAKPRRVARQKEPEPVNPFAFLFPFAQQK